MVHGAVKKDQTACAHCAHSGKAELVSIVTFDVLGLPDETPFPSIATRRRWVCQRCGSRKVG